MVKYLIFLFLGFVIGYFLKNDNLSKIRGYLVNLSVLILLFFMGVNIGKDPDLKNKISMFGYTAFVISFFTVLFSVVVVTLIMKFFRKRR